MRPEAEFMTAVSVRAVADGDRADWNTFVEQCPTASFFHLFEWRDIMRDVFRHRAHYLLAERAGRICGVLPLAQVKSRLFGHSLVSLPFGVYGGVAADDDTAAQALEAEAQRIAQSLGVDHLELRNVHARHPEWPTEDLYVTFRKEILPDLEANMNAIPRKQRAMVRKGIKNGLVARFDDDNERFFELYSDNVHRHGTPAMSRRYFDTLRATFGERCSVMTVESADGELLSSVMSFYFRDEILPYYAGDALAARDLAANDFKYWALMSHACERGIRVFDYGRSKQGTGSYSFKKNWGFEPTPLHYEYCLYKRDSLPRNNPSNPKYRLMIETWRRMPRSFANALGPFIVRNLG
ncbi:MAG: FemAB family PEP-CTERM system-associated protein [Gammaproteobacteria bacterium]|nr:FemAB family PEP-CTERM system-associated protein [Gammaproteobacteria bacterium]MBU0770631.1 FemAB family PEP-CTERM system-associated protein [Gammaproteobacteria bacterium]MBU0856203.1 FemAB family PEP-CTERM system-associated protein [Gammaproteobacteria bacterium]MBU1845610.1 FemAB family PEP-CTERM system-associated protein [Gammaproteobacteria bacterium]